MRSVKNHILSFKVQDVMSRDIFKVSVNTTMGEAAQLLHNQEVSGVPVVDELGHCVGVLSGSDFATRDRRERSGDSESMWDKEHEIVHSQQDTPLHIEWGSGDNVRQYMHNAVQTIDSQASLAEAAKVMCSEHVHRLIVLDEYSHPVGIASSLDLLGGFLKACEHSET